VQGDRPALVGDVFNRGHGIGVLVSEFVARSGLGGQPAGSPLSIRRIAELKRASYGFMQGILVEAGANIASNKLSKPTEPHPAARPEWNVVAGLRDLTNALVEQASQAQAEAGDEN
jgi:hypothetical protein